MMVRAGMALALALALGVGAASAQEPSAVSTRLASHIPYVERTVVRYEILANSGGVARNGVFQLSVPVVNGTLDGGKLTFEAQHGWDTLWLGFWSQLGDDTGGKPPVLFELFHDSVADTAERGITDAVNTGRLFGGTFNSTANESVEWLGNWIQGVTDLETGRIKDGANLFDSLGEVVCNGAQDKDRSVPQPAKDALKVHCVLNGGHGRWDGSWTWLPVDGGNGGGWPRVLIRYRDLHFGGENAEPVIGFVVHDTVSQGVVLKGASLPPSPETDLPGIRKREFRLWHLGDPLDAADALSTLKDGATLLFPMIAPDGATQVILPGQDMLVHYRGKGLAGGGVSLKTTSGSRDMTARAVEAALCRQRGDADCGHQPDLLDAVLPEDNPQTMAPALAAVPNWLHRRIASTAWPVPSPEAPGCHVEDEGLVGRPRPGQCARLGLGGKGNRNRDLAALFPKTCTAGQIESCLDLGLDLGTKRQPVCLKPADDGESVLVGSVLMPPVLRADSAAASFVLQEAALADEGEDPVRRQFHIAAGETTIGDWRGFLMGLGDAGGQKANGTCQAFLMDEARAPWLTTRGGSDSCLPPLASLEPPSDPRPESCSEGDDWCDYAAHRHTADAFAYFYSAVMAGVNGGPDLDFPDFVDSCIGATPSPDYSTMGQCRLRLFLTLRALQNPAAGLPDSGEPLPDGTELLGALSKEPEVRQGAVSACDVASSGLYIPSIRARQLCEALATYWKAAADSGTFERMPIAMTTPGDAATYAAWLGKTNDCGDDSSFRLPRMGELASVATPLEDSRAALASRSSRLAQDVDRWRFSMRAGLPRQTTDPAAIGTDRFGQTGIHGALTGLRERVTGTANASAVFGFAAHRSHETILFGGQPLWQTPWAPNGPSLEAGDPVTGFRLVFDP